MNLQFAHKKNANKCDRTKNQGQFTAREYFFTLFNGFGWMKFDRIKLKENAMTQNPRRRQSVIHESEMHKNKT